MRGALAGAFVVAIACSPDVSPSDQDDGAGGESADGAGGDFSGGDGGAESSGGNTASSGGGNGGSGGKTSSGGESSSGGEDSGSGGVATGGNGGLGGDSAEGAGGDTEGAGGDSEGAGGTAEGTGGEAGELDPYRECDSDLGLENNPDCDVDSSCSNGWCSPICPDNVSNGDDCPSALTGTATPECNFTLCNLACRNDEICPDGMECRSGDCRW